MDIHTARLIRELKKSSTYSRLAGFYYPDDHPGHENQDYGIELCKEALKVLYPYHDLWMMEYDEIKSNFDDQFHRDNHTYWKCGDMYWW